MATDRRQGRSTLGNPANRFASFQAEPLPLEVDPEDAGGVPTQFFRDASKTILSRNDSPDIPYTYSINPYRGCEHGCIYCYARPTHEYLGFSAGLDFESKIMVKEQAAALLEREFRKKRWTPQMICLSGNTDCYQPVERKLRITRSLLEVFARYRNPVGLITKNALVTRDLDLLGDLAARKLVLVTISVTTLDAGLARVMEPRTATPELRLATIRALARAGVPVAVNIAPVIPGLNDAEIPAILRAAANHGATRASYTMLRLPGAVAELFLGWLEREMPDRAGKIVNRLKDVRGGELSESRFGKRMRGDGEIASAIRQLFGVQRRALGYTDAAFEFDTSAFRAGPAPQGELFG
jgi:DNA repair photolyase